MAEAVETAPRAGAAVDDPARRNRMIGFSVAFAVLALDQAVKWFVTYILQLEQRQEIPLASIFSLRWTDNPGVSMGFFRADTPMERWLLVAMTAAIGAFVLVWLWREKRRDDVVALGLVLGGALGNILDRVRLGHVVDYADLHFGDVHPFLVFNLADTAITIGVLLLLVRALLTRERKAPLEDK